jgi:hypothetical protein
MHANLGLNPSVRAVLHYHEEKVKKGVAECIWAENFIKDHTTLSLPEKVYAFDLRAGYNDSVKKKMFHTTVQFGAEQEISNEKLAAAGREYMREMGYGDEPFLIYRHRDAARTHIHLVSTNIDREGQVIGISKFDLLRSHAITERLARKYGLENTEKMPETVAEAVKHLHKGLQYLYPAMNRVLEEVIPNYRYSSLEELNAILRLYEIQASRGKEQSVTYQRQGLHYHPLDAAGEPVRQYLAARRFPSRPTLANLEKRFAENLALKEGHRRALTVAVDFALAGKGLSFGALQEALAKKGISAVADRKSEGALWYIDHRSKTVFEGGALGKDYSLAGMEKRLVPDDRYQQQQLTERATQRQKLSL